MALMSLPTALLATKTRLLVLRRLFGNVSGDGNTAEGASALSSNTGGSHNTAVGAGALLNNTVTGNTGIGSEALRSNTTGGTLGNTQGFGVGPNVAVGWRALESNTTAGSNTAVGYQALRSFTEGQGGTDRGHCTAVGFQALANTTGFLNSGFGYQALYNNTTGFSNVAVGARALFNNGTGENNAALGDFALQGNTSGQDNTAIGYGTSTFGNHTGNGDTALGSLALESNTTGNNNTALGYQAGGSISTADNVICIGAFVSGTNVSNSCYIGSIFGQTSSGGSAVFINSTGKLGTSTSSQRFKDDIKPMEQASNILFALKPVTFRYKTEIDAAGTRQFGLVAEEVEGVNPDLIVRDKEGKPYSVRYDQVNAMLLNEFLKEHHKVQEQEATIALLKSTDQKQEAVITQLKTTDAKQEATIARQQKQIEALTAGLQKVSAQLELSKSAPQTVLNDD